MAVSIPKVIKEKKSRHFDFKV
jgi:hypothetical protein